MSAVRIKCSYCGLASKKPTGAVNRALKIGAALYCDRECAGLGRRREVSECELKARKKAYDAQRRLDLSGRLKAEKAAYYQRTRDPVREAAIRKARMHLHIEYCRRPEYVAKKSAYDQRRRDQMQFGEFAEVAALLRDVEKEVDQRATRYEVYQQNGTLNKAQTRRRSL